MGLEDWAYVNENYHNRFVPRCREVFVGNKSLRLQANQALALYVTFGSLSGMDGRAQQKFFYTPLFDISVHLWLRRHGSTAVPSSDEGLFPRMNEVDWFDTFSPCCVLHVPSR